MLQDRKYWRPGDPGEAVTQLHYARDSIIMEEMRYVAGRENMEPEKTGKRSRGGGMIVPANVNHTALEAMCIGKAARVNINANIGNSQTTSEIEAVLEKLRMSIKYGSTQ